MLQIKVSWDLGRMDRFDPDEASGLELMQVVEGLTTDSSRQIPR